MSQQRLIIIPLSLAQANEAVIAWHRHHDPVRFHKFSIGVADEAGQLRGAAIIGRPVSRHLDDGFTAEVTRCATDGLPNTCSALYAAAWRACRAMGYLRIGTYTLASEPGTSLRAAGWTILHEVKGHRWDTPSRRRLDKHPTVDKFYWGESA
jgi:hypothetical protein